MTRKFEIPKLVSYVNSLKIIQYAFRHETEKNQKKRKIATCEGAQRPNRGPGGGFGRGVPPPAENFAILGTENHVLMQRKIKKRGKLLHVRERSDRTSWGWVREGGSPSRRKFCNFRY